MASPNENCLDFRTIAITAKQAACSSRQEKTRKHNLASKHVNDHVQQVEDMENPNTNSASPATENYPNERDQELADLRGANLSLTQSLLNAHTSRNKLKKSLEERDIEIASLRSEAADLRGANNSLQASLMREYTSRRGQAGRPDEPEPNLSTLGK